MVSWGGAHILSLFLKGALGQQQTAVAGDETADYYGSFEVPTLQNTTYHEVRKLLLRGRPFTVVDGAKSLPMEAWDCDFVRREFPHSRIRQEGGNSDVNEIPMDSNWTTKKVPFARANAFPDSAPKLRPFYWDITKAHRDEGHRKWGKDPEKVVQSLVKHSAVPYWLPDQDPGIMGMSSEMWFHPPGAGAPAHMDPHCQTTVSFCFSGRRKWRMMLPPAEPHPRGYFDGEVYGARDRERRGEWRPTFEFDAVAGSAVVVFPGMVHETLSTGEQCSSSISQTFAVPIAAAYYRRFWPRFALIHEDVGQCRGLVEGMVTLGTGVRVPPAKKEKALRSAEEFRRKVDNDMDGEISEEEILRANQKEVHGERRTLEELVSFHDVNDDGIVTSEELLESWVMYASAMRRLQKRMARGRRADL